MKLDPDAVKNQTLQFYLRYFVISGFNFETFFLHHLQTFRIQQYLK